MFTEKSKHMDGESEKRFIGLLKEKMANPAKGSDPARISHPARASVPGRDAPKVDIPDLKSERQSISEKQSVAIKLKELESEHQTSIERSLKKIQELKDKREKLKKALDTLSELSLHIPEEYAQKLNSYPAEIEKLGTEIERERIYLNYLQTKVLPMFQ